MSNFSEKPKIVAIVQSMATIDAQSHAAALPTA